MEKGFRNPFGGFRLPFSTKYTEITETIRRHRTLNYYYFFHGIRGNFGGFRVPIVRMFLMKNVG